MIRCVVLRALRMQFSDTEYFTLFVFGFEEEKHITYITL